MIRSTLRPTPATRPAAATVEFAFCFIWLLVPMMVGIWEVGRAVQVQQMVATAAREGARLASQGRTITSAGAQTDIRATILPAANTTFQPNVKAAVMQSLAGSGLSGLTWADVTVNFAFTDGNTGNTDPYQGTKNQSFRVEVIVQYNAKVRIVESGLAGFVGVTALQSTTRWQMLLDDPFTVVPAVPAW
jgi:Flp pilus assembly protein TadG